MRTTVTLDEDVAAKLGAEVRRTGKPFKIVLNECPGGPLGGPRAGTPGVLPDRAADLGAAHAQPPGGA